MLQSLSVIPLLTSSAGPACVAAGLSHLRDVNRAIKAAFSSARSCSSSPTSSTDSGANAQVGRLNHVAIAVPDLEVAAQRYRTVLGAKVSAPQPVLNYGVTVVFVELPNTKIELLHPLGQDSPIAGFLRKNPSGGIHHICLEVGDINASMGALSGRGMRLLASQPQLGAHGNPVVFIHPKDNDGVLLELEQVSQATAEAPAA